MRWLMIAVLLALVIYMAIVATGRLDVSIPHIKQERGSDTERPTAPTPH